jgi:hypothetical protein
MANTEEYAVCVSNAGFAASLEVRKLYAVVVDEAAAGDGLIRVIDESGEDYLYPAAMFERVRLPGRVVRGLRATG